jgi:translocator protein
MKPFKLIASIALPLFAGFLGSLANMASLDTWYETIAKPVFNPPNWVFAPVWTLLFILMGISLYIVWEKNSRHKRTALLLFGVQLLLNILWSALFFGLRNPLAAFIEILALLGAIVLTIILFGRISKPAAYLLVPYLLWVSFAAILNISIVILNL